MILKYHINTKQSQLTQAVECEMLKPLSADNNNKKLSQNT